jgi:hypothetical protein
MWEQEQGRTLSDKEKRTIDRGCIGITANNVAGGGNPPLDVVFGTFEQAHGYMQVKNRELRQMRADPQTRHLAPARGQYILFAKQFWSNQSEDDEERKKPRPDAFRADPRTGRVDMSGYHYHAQPGYVNFDYGFWDDASDSFWHANHSQPGMKVFQSTKEHFIRGYSDFDRCVFGVAFATNYDPGRAAIGTAARAGGGASHGR